MTKKTPLQIKQAESVPPKSVPKLLFIHHLLELRKRLILSLVFLAIASFIGYLLNDQILALLMKPLDKPLFYSSPTGGLDFLINTSVLFGLIISIPFFIFQIFKFIEPILPDNTKIRLIKIVIWSIIFMAWGLATAYFLILPSTLHFLNKFNSDKVQPLISVHEYFSFVMLYLIGFAVLFQLPLVLLLIHRVVPLNTKILMQKQKYVIVVSFIIAAVITPTPDFINQTIMAIPLILLYQAGIAFIWLAT